MGAWVRGLDPEQWARAGDILVLVGARYPILLAYPMKPLAVDTGDRLVLVASQLGLTEADIKLAMIRHTRSRSYLEAILRGGARYNLDGEVEGEVEPSQIEFARIKLDRRRARQMAVAAKRRSAIVSGQAMTSSASESEASDQTDDARTKSDVQAAGESADDGDLSTRVPDLGDPAHGSRCSGTEDRAA